MFSAKYILEEEAQTANRQHNKNSPNQIEDWADFLGVRISTTISGPVRDFDTLDWKNHEVKLFSNIGVDTTKAFEAKMIGMWKNLAKGQELDFDKGSNMGRYYQPVNYCIPLCFLLLDDEKEALRVCINIQQYATPGPSTLLRSLLLDGHRKQIRNWDLKILCALKYIFGDLSNLLQNVGDFTESTRQNLQSLLKFNYRIKRETDSAELNDDILKDILLNYETIAGDEDKILSTFKTRIFKIFKVNKKWVSLELINKLMTHFKGKGFGEREIESWNSCTWSPLTFILELICDGYLCKKEDFDIFASLFPDKESTSNLLKEVLIEDIPTLKKPYRPKTTQFDSVGGVVVRKGHCIIINQTFQGDPVLKRHGTERDEEKLIKVWNKLGCRDNIYVKRDLSRADILSAFKDFIRIAEGNPPDFMVVIVLSHGRINPKTGQDEIIDIKKKGLSFNKIKNVFIDGKNCPLMVGKPKLFYFQACRGNQRQCCETTADSYSMR